MKKPAWLTFYWLGRPEFGVSLNREAGMLGIAIYKFGILADWGRAKRIANRQKLVMAKTNTRCETCDKHIVKHDMGMVQRFCSKECRKNRQNVNKGASYTANPKV